MDRGYFVISLDFELIYGMLDVLSEDDPYYKNLFGARTAIPRILNMFKKYSVAATWAVVGMLFNSNETELMANNPSLKPHYYDRDLSVYNHLNDIKEDKYSLLFAKDLISMIAECPNQEIATHTYGHYYCTEAGQTIEEFEADIKQAKKIMVSNGCEAPYSIVFPRNMYNEGYLHILRNNDIRTYRGEINTWYNIMQEGYIKKAIRLMDAYVNICGNECSELKTGDIIDIPASRFLYHHNKIPHFDFLKLHRIKAQMKYAAIHKKVFHLWWHPHNFGINLEDNLKDLKILLDYYCYLREKYNMASANMRMLGEKFCSKTE